MTTIDWQNYFFHADFTGHGEFLSQLPIEELSTENAKILAEILATVDTGSEKDKWGIRALEGVEVIYNDINVTRLPAKYGYQYALGLNFPENDTSITGRCYLVWNA